MKHIIEFAGQEIEVELKLMSEPPELGEYVLIVDTANPLASFVPAYYCITWHIGGDNQGECTDEEFEETGIIGWTPMPVYVSEVESD